MNKIIQNYELAKQALYDHVGFVEDWVVYAIDDKTSMFWQIVGNEVKYSESKDNLQNEEGDYYADEIYKQRFYSNHVYEGTEVTLIFCDPHTDGCKWFRVFDNSKRI